MSGIQSGTGRSRIVAGKMVVRGLLLFAILVVAAGCVDKPTVSYQTRRSTSVAEQKSGGDLMDYFRHWQAVPYRSGGMDRRGVDCSGFVWLTYRDCFGRMVPRTTDELARFGHPVTSGERRAGDLVLFKTGWFSRHAGIMVDRDRFIHASAAKGVTLSSLSEPYWRDSFWQIRRVVP